MDDYKEDQKPIHSKAIARVHVNPAAPKLTKHSICPCGSGRRYKNCCKKEMRRQKAEHYNQMMDHRAMINNVK